MKISRLFNLNKSQNELDFIDININRDIPLFLDPYFLSHRKDVWSRKSSAYLSIFFYQLINKIKNNDIKGAKELFLYLGEPNQTCLGLSSKQPMGRGLGKINRDDIFNKLLKSKAIQTGLVNDIEDNIIFVEGIGKDKLSDMTTNIIKKQLIVYTQDQCKLWGIPLTKDVPTDYFWDIDDMEWKVEYDDMLVIKDKKYLLIPKGIVSYSEEYTPEKYYNHFVLNFLQNEHLSLNTALVQVFKYKNGEEKKFVTKKSVRNDSPYSKEFIRKFTLKNPDIFRKFRKNTQFKLASLTNEYLDNYNVNEIAEILIKQLRKIPTGINYATEYHRLIIGILEFLFYPNLIYPKIEQGIHSGRKRIDISFDNAANDGYFFRLQKKFKIPCQYIFGECKNYSGDPKNPELDQLSGRFSLNRGKMGFLICRNIEDIKIFIKRCRDTYVDDRGLIIPIVDKDLIMLLNFIRNRNYEAINDFLSERTRNIIMG